MMKKRRKISFTILILFLFNSLAAQQTNEKLLNPIGSYRLEISDTKTSNIIFPYAIVSVDRGSIDILVQKAKGVENILQVKAAKAGFAESNISVVTADGALHTFEVTYAAEPDALNMSLITHPVGDRSIFIPKENINEAEVRKNADLVIQGKPQHPTIMKERNDIDFRIRGIHIQNNVLYFRIHITNWSHVDYDVEQLRFFIRDQKKAKRTASQETEVVPVYVQNPTNKIAGREKKELVFALPKFTIPDNKFLIVQLMEKNGGRHVALRVKSRHILNATLIK